MLAMRKTSKKQRAEEQHMVARQRLCEENQVMTIQQLMELRDSEGSAEPF